MGGGPCARGLTPRPPGSAVAHVSAGESPLIGNSSSRSATPWFVSGAGSGWSPQEQMLARTGGSDSESLSGGVSHPHRQAPASQQQHFTGSSGLAVTARGQASVVAACATAKIRIVSQLCMRTPLVRIGTSSASDYSTPLFHLPFWHAARRPGGPSRLQLGLQPHEIFRDQNAQLC